MDPRPPPILWIKPRISLVYNFHPSRPIWLITLKDDFDLLLLRLWRPSERPNGIWLGRKWEQEWTSRVRIDVLRDPHVVGLYSSSTDLLGSETRSGRSRSTGNYVIGSYSSLGPYILGPTHRNVPKSTPPSPHPCLFWGRWVPSKGVGTSWVSEDVKERRIDIHYIGEVHWHLTHPQDNMTWVCPTVGYVVLGRSVCAFGGLVPDHFFSSLLALTSNRVLSEKQLW